MSKRNVLVTFEKFAEPEDHFSELTGQWQEVTKAWVELAPVAIFAQRAEFIDASQNTSTRKSIAKTACTRKLLELTNKCRMKVKKLNLVRPDEPGHDANFRIFNIEQIVNVDEANRELNLMVTEKV